MPLVPGPDETLHESPNEVDPPPVVPDFPALYCVPDGLGGNVVVFFRDTQPLTFSAGPYYQNDRGAAEAACV